MTQNEIVLYYMQNCDIISRIEIHEETGICQNSLGVVLKRLTEKGEIDKLDDGVYSPDELYRIRLT